MSVSWAGFRCLPYLPAVTALASAVVLAATSTWTGYQRPPLNPTSRRPLPTTHIDDESAEHLPLFVTKQLRNLELYTVVRLVGCLILCSLAMVCVLREKSLEYALQLVVFLYTAILAVCGYHLPRTFYSLRRRNIYTTHLDMILLAQWTTSISLTTLRQNKPASDPMGDLFQVTVLYYAKLVLITIVGVLVPLLRPRIYLGAFEERISSGDAFDIDAEDRILESLPAEETSSLINFLTYSYLDPYVWRSYRDARKGRKKLGGLVLPELAYDDRAEVLSSRSESILGVDNSLKSSRRHLFGALLSLHLVDHVGMAVLLALHVLASYGAPFGLERVLNYLEDHRFSQTISGERSSPIPWLALLFLGPVTAALLLQLYAWLGARVALRVEGALMVAIMQTGIRARARSHRSAEPDSNQDQTQSNVSVDSLLTTDVANIREARDWLLLPICVPLNVGLGIVFLYSVLGASAFMGLSVIAALLPVPGWFAARIREVEVARMGCTDGRVEAVGEAVGLLRMIKLFGWERYIGGRVEKQREAELACIKRRRVLEMGKGVANFLIPVATMLATYATYVTLLMHQQLTASKVFSSMAVFDILRGQFHLTFHTLSQIVAGKVSLDRVEQYLENTELLDRFTDATLNDADEAPVEDEELDTVIGFEGASFAWSASVHENRTARPFTLRIEGRLGFPPGSLTLVVGPTGSGKTALLMALLGEMHFVADGGMQMKGWYNLPRGGGVAYAAQETWVLNDSIRNNILFGAPYDEHRYRTVLQQCALEPDLALFAAGDATEVGEKGTTLSGGQKARITLARAVYSDAEVLLLDDVFAALDVHTSQSIIEKCFGGELMKGRTVVLVTHNVAMAKKIATHVVRIGQDGRVVYHGTINKVLLDVLSKHATLEDGDTLVEAIENINADTVTDSTILPSELTGKLVVDEEVEDGRVNLDAVKLYLSSLGGKHYFLFFLMFGGGIVTTELLGAGQTWFLGYWAAQYDGPSEVKILRYLGIYSAILGCSMVVYVTAYVVYIYGGVRASRTIHRKLISSILGTTLRWLDTTPTSRIISRCTQDIGAVDGAITSMIQWLTELTVSMLVKLGAIVIITPPFLGPGLTVALFSGWLCQVYMTSQLAVKREMSNARAPIIGHFGTMAAGIVSIRAYGAQDIFIKEAWCRIDRYSRAARTFYNLTRWITIRLDFIGALFTCSLATYLVYFQPQSASNTGFSLNMSISLSGMILYWVMFANELELQGTSVERIQAYLHIDQEPKNSGCIPSAYWPASGDLRVEKLSARYSMEGPDVLHDISFHVKAGEHVGIVGRTGSGKSSLTLALLRSILITGEVYYDGLRTDQINLENLRTNVTIIPQVPEMLIGTLRQNLDPFEAYDDAHLNDALRAAGLFSLQCSEEGGNVPPSITLDTLVSSGGSNISVGQRQIIALARAFVRGSKLLILDEATSAIDYQTDLLIQSTLRHQLDKDVTLLTIAHRIHTVIDADKIMVLDQGHVVEFDTPQSLLQKPDGFFKSLVENAGIQSKNLHESVDDAKKERTNNLSL